MPTVFIGRLDQVGFGLEVTAGSSVSPTVWLPKRDGGISPHIESAKNESSYGNITKTRDTQVTKELGMSEIKGTIDDFIIGYMLYLAMGATYETLEFTSNSGTGTFVEGETVTESVSSATGTVRRVDITAGVGKIYVTRATGTFTGGQTLTGGTSSATAVTAALAVTAAQGKTHLFRLLNTNNHPTISLWEHNPLGDYVSLYSMMDELTLEVAIGKFAEFTAKFMGKKIASGAAQTPAYATENPMLAKFGSLKYASTFATVGAGTAISLESFKLTIKKNAEAVQSFGSTDITSIHNKAFEVTFELTCRYDATTLLALVEASTSEALRLTLQNTDVALGSSYPTLQIDIPQAGFETWSKTTDNDGIVRQTIGGLAEWNVSRSLPIEFLLTNSKTTAYTV